MYTHKYIYTDIFSGGRITLLFIYLFFQRVRLYKV